MKGRNPLEEAEAMLTLPGTRSAAAAPRGHAKSTLMSLKNAFHAALYGYKKYILLISDTEGQAAGFLDAVKNELETNEAILRDFGEQAGKTWKTSSVVLKNGCRIDAMGSGQKLRGRRNYERRLRLGTDRGHTLFGAETNQFQWFLKEQLTRESARQGLSAALAGLRVWPDKPHASFSILKGEYPMTDTVLTYAIEPRDVPEEFRDVARELGMEAFLKLVALCGGQDLYIPKRESLERGPRDRAIRARFSEGGDYRTLAAQYRLSVRQIRKIINGTRT